jgi:hypothetical protein
MNELEAIATLLGGFAVVLGGIFAVLKVVYRRGADERESTNATRENTQAVKELADSMRDFKDYTVASLHDVAISHERLVARVDVIETKLKDRS